MGNRAWGMAKKLPMPNAQCPKRRGGCPSPPTRGWSFPPLSIKLLFDACAAIAIRAGVGKLLVT
ncbi:hypothetical protein NIES3275_24940 [Microchaete diplosiphon NIES-3275]|nr:hypothetical protein NIES3275_24940 [Microchaete diplosiphon NIES-3275]